MRYRAIVLLVLVCFVMTSCSNGNKKTADSITAGGIASAGQVDTSAAKMQDNTADKVKQDATAAVQGNTEDKTQINEAMKGIVDSLNNAHFNGANKSFSRTNDLFFIGGSELETPNYPNIDMPAEYNLTIEYSDVRVFENSAVSTHYLSGSIIFPYPQKNEGPWRVSVFWVKKDGAWLVEHTHFSELKVNKLKYLAQMPKEYKKGSGKKWPLILFRHGSGERGSNLELVKKNGIPKLAAEKNLPFVVISPQCPAKSTWDTQLYALNKLLDEVIKEYDVDTERIYLTGLSMGGVGTWDMAMAHPERFAAIAPVSGWSTTNNIERLKGIPVWAFHGEKDSVIPIRYEQEPVDALKACGGDVKFTKYPEVKHEAWELAYNDPELFTWFLAHTKK